MYDYENDTQAILLNINEAELGFSRYAVNSNIKFGIKRIYCTIEEDNVSNFDYLANNLAWLIVSEKVKKIMEDCNIGTCEFIPIVNKGNEIVIGYLVHCMNILQALDEKKSLCKKFKYVSQGKEYEHTTVIKYVIYSCVIKNSDMFKLKESNIPYFVSETLKKKLLDIGVKGFDFMKIKTS